MKKKTIHIISLIIIFALLLSTLSGCSEKGKVDKLISKFEKSCRDLDVDKMLDCIDPRYSKMVRGLYGLVGGVIGVDLDSITDLLYGIMGFSFAVMDDNSRSELNSSLDVFRTIRIKPIKYEFNKDNDVCTVTANCSITVDGEKRSEDVVFKCFLYDNEWYLAAM